MENGQQKKRKKKKLKNPEDISFQEAFEHFTSNDLQNQNGLQVMIAPNEETDQPQLFSMIFRGGFI